MPKRRKQKKRSEEMAYLPAYFPKKCPSSGRRRARGYRHIIYIG
jgi:hypothetical protein